VRRRGRSDYREVDPARARRISAIALPLGLGSLALSVVLAGAVVYLALAWVKDAPLLAMTVGVHGAMALIGIFFGFAVMSMRAAVSADRLDVGSANAIRRNLLVLWNLSLLMACLGWLAFGAGTTTARVPIGPPAIIVDILVPAVLVVYNGAVTVLASRLLRS
jgi:hypothetical protein